MLRFLKPRHLPPRASSSSLTRRSSSSELQNRSPTHHRDGHPHFLLASQPWHLQNQSHSRVSPPPPSLPPHPLTLLLISASPGQRAGFCACRGTLSCGEAQWEQRAEGPDGHTQAEGCGLPGPILHPTLILPEQLWAPVFIGQDRNEASVLLAAHPEHSTFTTAC